MTESGKAKSFTASWEDGVLTVTAENALDRVADICSAELSREMKNAIIEILTADKYGH